MSKMKERMGTATILGIEILFLVTCWLIGDYLPTLGNWLFPLVAVAAFRGGRAIAFNEVFKWLRDLCGVTVSNDPSGAGETTVLPTKDSGIKYPLAQLVCCPICAGTWFGLSLLVVWVIDPGMGRALIYVMAVAGVAELLHWLTEYFEWGGQAFREQAGTEHMTKRGRR